MRLLVDIGGLYAFAALASRLLMLTAGRGARRLLIGRATRRLRARADLEALNDPMRWGGSDG